MTSEGENVTKSIETAVNGLRTAWSQWRQPWYLPSCSNVRGRGLQLTRTADIIRRRRIVNSETADISISSAVISGQTPKKYYQLNNIRTKQDKMWHWQRVMFEGGGEGVGLTNPALTLRLYYLPFRGPCDGRWGGGGEEGSCAAQCACVHAWFYIQGGWPGAGEERSAGRSLVVKREPQKVLNGDPAPGDF